MVDQDLPEVRSGLSVGVSVSGSEDLGRFGVTETHVQMALGEIARAVLIADGRLAYGGHLEEGGYTAFLIQEVRRSGRRNRPFTGYVPLPVHRAMPVADITARVEELSILGTYVFLDVDGTPIDPVAGRQADPEPVDELTEKAALTAARTVMSDAADTWVALGGQRTGYRGRMPGVVEETILAIQRGKPVYIAGGYGGVAGDMAVALGIDRENWLGLNPHPSPHLNELNQAVADANWMVESNGLTEDENQRLAITYRASEVASLIVTGLSRLGGTS